MGATNLLVEHTGASSDDVGLMAQPAGHDAGRSWRGDLAVTHLKWDDQRVPARPCELVSTHGRPTCGA